MMRENTRITFSEKEADFLLQTKLGRVATVSREGQPHAVPVAYHFDGTYFYFGGYHLMASLKAKNIKANSKVAFVVDDVITTNPWRPRGIEIRGIAEILEEDGKPYVRITPVRKVTWGELNDSR
jgi:pyridoxamine 5'-phosphate oxidase family protein